MEELLLGIKSDPQDEFKRIVLADYIDEELRRSDVAERIRSIKPNRHPFGLAGGDIWSNYTANDGGDRSELPTDLYNCLPTERVIGKVGPLFKTEWDGCSSHNEGGWYWVSCHNPWDTFAIGFETWVRKLLDEEKK